MTGAVWEVDWCCDAIIHISIYKQVFLEMQRVDKCRKLYFQMKWLSEKTPTTSGDKTANVFKSVKPGRRSHNLSTYILPN